MLLSLWIWWQTCPRTVASRPFLIFTGEPSIASQTHGGLRGYSGAFTLDRLQLWWQTCPTELVKCKLQAARETGHSGAGAGGIVRGIFREKGFLGFFQGLVPLWCRDVPGYFCFFLSYEGSRSVLASWGGRSKDALTAPETMLCGGLAGVCFWTCVFPMDVVKSRIQVRGIQGSVLSIGLNIVRLEGAATLYRGLTPALLRIFPSNASLFLAYETTKKFLAEEKLDK